jgi:hypothetical protein
MSALDQPLHGLEFCSLGLLCTVPHCNVGCTPRPACGRNQGEWHKYPHRAGLLADAVVSGPATRSCKKGSH